MRITASAALVAIALAGSIHGTRTRVQADDAETNSVARAEHFAESAFEAFSRGQYHTAVALYGEALEAAPSPEILYNLARIYDTKLRDRSHAIEYYARYAQDPGAEPERLQVATERLLALREQERVTARSVAQHAARSEAVKPGGPTRVLAPKQYERGLSGYEVAGFVVGAFGVASIATGVGFAFAAKSDADVVHSLCDGNACATQRGVDAAQRGNRMALISTVGFAAGGGLLVVGAGLLLFGPRRMEREDGDRARHAQRAAVVLPVIDRGTVGVALASAF